jgi:multidrug efflux pump subunit AcrA (membrane-fusion protein)
MKSAFVCAFLVSAAMGLAACNKAESPDKVQADVDKATSEAAANNAKADEGRKQAEAQASEELAKAKADAEAKAADKSVGAVADSAVVEAEGATKVALAKCEALDGDAQKQCKDQANAHLATVKERAKASKSE